MDTDRSSQHDRSSARPDVPAPALGSLYQELILDHYKRPRNKGPLEGADVDIHMNNPVCGDEVRLRLRLDHGRIADARFEGQGCSISQASTSMMTRLLEGKSTAQAHALAARFTAMLHGDAEAARDKALGDLRALAGVSQYPVRVKCALLAWNALEEGLERRTR